MGAPAADGSTSTGHGFRFEQNGVEIVEILELQSRNFLADETFDRLERGNFFAVHERKRVTDVLSAPGATDAMYIIFGMLGHIVIDDMTDAGDVEPARSDVSRNHDFVFAALESLECLDAFTLRAIRV